MDANPYSETYGQERTERVLDTEECPVQQPANYVQIYTYCEMTPNGAYTGNCVRVFEDVEPLSPTYGEQREELYTDGVLCPPDSAEADWQQIDQYCEQIEYQPSGKLGNSGYQITVFMDMGSFSPTYGQTRETRESDIVHCQVPNTEPVWVEVRWECHLENGVQNGTKDVWMVNTNEYSPEYDFGTEVCFNVEDVVNCPRNERAPIWSLISSTCLQEYGYNTGYITEVFEDTNSLSETYGQTKTETRLDTEDCPVQEPDLIRWTIINNRSASTDTVTSATLHLNNNFNISANGSIAPVGGSLSGSAIIPVDLKSTNLVVSSIDLSPNTSLPVQYQFSQNPNPYVWSSSNTLTVTLWDGDGTGPEWTETSYSCETVDGYRTGAAIVVEEDMNPNSGTYGQTRTRVVENDPRCPAQTDADWIEISWTCEQINGFNTGNRLSVQIDQNPNSPTYNQTRTRIIADSENCPVDTTANWVEESWACETDLPNWVETSRTCELDNDNQNTGNAIITETDQNPISDTYGQTRTRVAEDFVNCPPPSYPIGYYKVHYTRQSDTDIEKPCDNYNYISQILIDSDRNSIKTATIGSCVTMINNFAFDNCPRLTSVIIPNNITQIKIRAFSRCPLLSSVTCLATTPPTIADDIFYGSTSELTIYVPSESVTAYKRAAGWSNYSDKIQAITNS